MNALSPSSDEKPTDSAPILSCNIASHLPAMAMTRPSKRAVVLPCGRDEAGRVAYTHLTFAQLDEDSSAYARGLERIGITRGVRTVLMVPPSLDFFALVFALFKVGAVIVMIDPGIDRKWLLKCLDEVKPEAFVGVPAAHVARMIYRKPFQHVKASVTVGKKWFWGGHTLSELKDEPGTPYTIAETHPKDLAAVLFTSGSTGVPKGAMYTHGVFDSQVRLLKKTYDIASDEIDLSTFPLFALFSPALGMTSVIPDMDSRKPAEADPVKLIEAIVDQGATQMFGSPALLNNLSRYGEAHNIQLPSLKRVLSAGAPVPPVVMARMQGMLCGDAQVFTPYGATESLPVCNVGSHMILGETADKTARGAGVCVGFPVSEMTVRVIDITDAPIATWDEVKQLPAGVIGEITVKGPVVTESYFGRDELTALAKIKDGDDVVHRMGDLGYLDGEGRLWMCGRKTHRVETSSGPLYTVPCEAIFNQHPAVFRSALVGVGQQGQQVAVLCVELRPEPGMSWQQVQSQLMTLGSENRLTQNIAKIVHYPDAFPVDIRHNAKIGREKLSLWAQEQLK